MEITIKGRFSYNCLVKLSFSGISVNAFLLYLVTPKPVAKVIANLLPNKHFN